MRAQKIEMRVRYSLVFTVKDWKKLKILGGLEIIWSGRSKSHLMARGRNRIHFLRLQIFGVAGEGAEVAGFFSARAAHEAYWAVTSIVYKIDQRNALNEPKQALSKTPDRNSRACSFYMHDFLQASVRKILVSYSRNYDRNYLESQEHSQIVPFELPPPVLPGWKFFWQSWSRPVAGIRLFLRQGRIRVAFLAFLRLGRQDSGWRWRREWRILDTRKKYYNYWVFLSYFHVLR